MGEPESRFHQGQSGRVVKFPDLSRRNSPEPRRKRSLIGHSRICHSARTLSVTPCCRPSEGNSKRLKVTQYGYATSAPAPHRCRGDFGTCWRLRRWLLLHQKTQASFGAVAVAAAWFDFVFVFHVLWHSGESLPRSQTGNKFGVWARVGRG